MGTRLSRLAHPCPESGAAIDMARNESEGIDPLLPLTPVVLHTLLTLAAGPSHGYAIAGEVEDVTDGRVRMGPGTLYGSLQRMLDDGLVEETENPGEEGLHAERRRYYRITARGIAALRAETARLERAVELAHARLRP